MDSNLDASSADEKFTDLELKYSFQEKHELVVLKQHLAESSEADSKAEQYSSEDERPPHY
jgi:uncharacterized coiled-coil protein SlyX